MTLYLIGLGLGDEKDITLRGLEIVKRCDVVYLENYTSLLGARQEQLEHLYGRKILLADRILVEQQAETALIAPARTQNVALLVIGDPLGATTHTDLLLRAREHRVPAEVIHNTSILTAVGAVGLQLYKYGATTSIPFPEEGFVPESPYDVITENLARGLHTLCLLDIKVDEPSREALLSGKLMESPAPRFMTVPEALHCLLEIGRRRGDGIVTMQTFVVGVARIGSPDQRIIGGPLAQLLESDFGAPPHAVIIPGKLHLLEEEYLNAFRR
jgi:diphthine methyl ester synthase